MEKKAAKAAMDAIASNIKAVKAEKSERQLAAKYIQEATSAERKYNDMRARQDQLDERWGYEKTFKTSISGGCPHCDPRAVWLPSP